MNSKRRAMARIVTMSLLAVTISGCSMLNDFKAPKYACGLPNGVGCKSVSDVYKLSASGKLPESKAVTTGNNVKTGSVAPATTIAGGSHIATVAPGEPILTRPRHMRVWIDRWEDKSGDLHDETYLYVRMDNGRWMLQ